MKKKIDSNRSFIKRRISNKSKTFTAVVGPCSISSEKEAIIYDSLLSKLQDELGDSIFLVMRTFVEKSRTGKSWRGFVYQPERNDRENILYGVERTKKMFSQLSSPLSMEFVDPFIAPLLSPYISWGFIGARTSTSTTHRLLASNANFPFGIKNPLDGCVMAAINGCIFAKDSHCMLSKEGQIYTKGNPHTHVVLRGGVNKINYDQKSTTEAYSLQKKHNIHTPILIDCSHDNCINKPNDQKTVFYNVVNQYISNPKKILGVMIESNVYSGSIKNSSTPGISITDPCISFEETRELLLWAKKEITSQRYMEELYQPTSYEYNH